MTTKQKLQTPLITSLRLWINVMVIYGSIACGCLIEFQRKEKNQAHIAPVCSLTQTENTLILTK